MAQSGSILVAGHVATLEWRRYFDRWARSLTGTERLSDAVVHNSGPGERPPAIAGLADILSLQRAPLVVFHWSASNGVCRLMAL